jgi:predicted Zn-dependent protease
VSGKSRKEQLAELLALEPDDPFLRYGLAMEHAGAGQDAEAALCLEELLRRTPDYVPAYLQAGQVLLRLGKDGEARRVLELGMEVAARAGNEHARGEMAGLLASI